MVRGTPAIFLDRDGVVTKMSNHGTEDHPEYTAAWELSEVGLLPGVVEGLRRVSSLYPIFIVTNQPEYGKELHPDTLKKFHDYLYSVLPVTEIVFCEKRGSFHYKPAPGMVLDLIKKHNIDPTRSFMIGDRWKDIACGKLAGIGTTILLDDKYHVQKDSEFIKPDVFCKDLYQACKYIVMQS